jgi:general secretion pathway protein I
MKPRGGFSLLEVILAIAILAGTIAILGELISLGVRNARAARDMTQAELLAESKMAEVAAGIMATEAVQGAPCESDPDNWLYSIAVDPTEVEGLMSVTVTVTQNLPPEQRPAEFSLVRWMRDPVAIETAEANAAAATASTEE